jgi:hypothetical protein
MSASANLPYLFSILGGALFLLFTFRRVAGGGGALAPVYFVLRKFAVDHEAKDGVVVNIVGRRPGFIPWLLTAMGMDADIRLKVSDEEISFESSSLSKQEKKMIPLPNVSYTACGYYKPFSLLAFGVILFIAGPVLWALDNRNGGIELLVLWIIAAICLSIYLFSRMLLISIMSVDGYSPIGISFKPSLIEGVQVDINKAAEVVRLINQYVVLSQGPNHVAAALKPARV